MPFLCFFFLQVALLNYFLRYSYKIEGKIEIEIEKIEIIQIFIQKIEIGIEIAERTRFFNQKSSLSFFFYNLHCLIIFFTLFTVNSYNFLRALFRPVIYRANVRACPRSTVCVMAYIIP